MKNFKSRNIRINTNRKAQGYSFLEILLGVAIIGAVSVMIISGMSSNKKKSQAQAMMNDVSSITNNLVQQFAAGGGTYAGLNNQVAISMNAVPGGGTIVVPTSGSTLKDVWGGQVTIASANSDQSFTIQYTQVPPQVCNSVITSLGGSSFTKIEIGGQVVFQNDSTANTPLEPGNVGTQCNAGGNSTTIIFTVG